MSPLRSRVLTALAPRLAYAYIRLLGATVRVTFRNREALARAREAHGPYVLVFWHARLVMMRQAYPDDRMTVLHSRHRDSRLLGQVMRRFGIDQAWGSTTDGGAAGLRDVLRRARAGSDIGIAPDGPRGPRRRVQPGVIALARLSGAPIVPVAYSARPARRLGSWDKTLVPLPFGRALFVYGDPFRVARDADPAACEAARVELERILDRLTDEADDAVGFPREDPRT
jgi:lysophospholipid acyltransferase (LPLAT)-like uncharacterized protein